MGTPNYSTAGEEQPILTYNWIPQFYGKMKGETKLLYTRSFARSILRFVDIDDDGIIKIASSEQESIDKAKKMVHDIVDEAENGKIYSGKVVKVVDFGAFVNFMGKKDGLVHISALSEDRVDKVSDVVNEGDDVKVKVIGFDKRGKVRLSMKEVDQKTGKAI